MFHMYFGFALDRDEEIIDQITLVEMPEGKSYTGQRQAEIFCHGGRFVLTRILKEIFSLGARPAEPGEFTRRAFLSGRIDLASAEAVADLVAAQTEYAYQTARQNLLGFFSEQIEDIRREVIAILAEIEASIDYPEEGLEAKTSRHIIDSLDRTIAHIGRLVDSYKAGRIIREGYKIAVAGRTNAGKSSLFNRLLNQNRALVASLPGTTRDYLTEWIDLDGMAVSLTDTAGIRATSSRLEKAGQKSSEEIVAEADLIVWIADISRPKWSGELKSDLDRLKDRQNIQIVLNKIDKIKRKNKLTDPSELPADRGEVALISCLTGAGLDDLRSMLIGRINETMPDTSERMVVTSLRHQAKLAEAQKSFTRASQGIRQGQTPELTAFDLRQGINEIDEITGKVYNEEILDEIFSRFCIGK